MVVSPYVYLSVAIASEVVGTLALRASRGFTQLAPSVLVIGAYSLAFYMLSLALREMSVGTAYAIWSGIGTAIVAIAGAVLFGERLTVRSVLGIALIIVGVVLLETTTGDASPTEAVGRVADAG
jgi:multidrug transporter EmrE-like cation transporter